MKTELALMKKNGKFAVEIKKLPSPNPNFLFHGYWVGLNKDHGDSVYKRIFSPSQKEWYLKAADYFLVSGELPPYGEDITLYVTPTIWEEENYLI